MTVKILVGDCRAVLKTLADESVHCVVTSPPYWGLRAYGTEPKIWGGDRDHAHAWGENIAGNTRGGSGTPTDKNNRGEGYARGLERGNLCACGAWRGELGLEPTYERHIANMVEIFADVRRVLRKDGTLWLNYGDSYAAQANGRSAADTKAAGNDDRTFRDKPFSTVGGVLKSKDLVGMPWRVALALQADGWYLRCDIIWSKPNPMPESIKDRPTKSHEYIFLLTKSERYFYDAEAIAEPAIYVGVLASDANGFKNPARFDGKYAKAIKTDKQRGHGRRHAGFNERWDAMTKAEQCSGTRNRRSVWEIATAAFSEAHFATFPPELVEPCIKAGTSTHGCCVKCGAPWKRETVVSYENPGARKTNGPRSTGNRAITAGFDVRLEKSVATIGWVPSCTCEIVYPLNPALVLDPFFGSGTVGLVADRLGRNCIGIELNPEYATMAERRIRNDGPLFAEVAK